MGPSSLGAILITHYKDGVPMVDSIEYTVETKHDRLEIRKYPRMILATVHGLSDNEAFGYLFDFISGHNRPKSKIAMTTPVISSEKIAMTTPVISNERSFSFVMPSEYSPATMPEPLEEVIKIEEVPERRVAVIRFRGRTGIQEVETRTSELLAELGRRQIRTTGDPFLMRYNPPFMPGFLRRNEVGVEIP